MSADASAVITAAIITGVFLILSKVWDKYFSDKERRGRHDADLMNAEDNRVRLSDERQLADYKRLEKQFEDAERRHKMERAADREVIKRLTKRVSVLESALRETNLPIPPTEDTDPNGIDVS